MAELAQNGVMTEAMNHLQCELGKPPVEEVRYDGETDRFYWRGPKTCKRVSMDRKQFYDEIFSPYLVWAELHHATY